MDVGVHTDKKWIARLPHSKMARPTNPIHFVKYLFWKVAGPAHPYARDITARLGLFNFNQFVDEKGRQQFLLGTIAAQFSAKDVIECLIAHGYGNHFIAWKDSGEVASLRLVDGFTHQYHVRIFNDGEVRAHYELTPEAYPIKHYYEVGMEERGEYFQRLLGHMIEKISSI